MSESLSRNLGIAAVGIESDETPHSDPSQQSSARSSGDAGSLTAAFESGDEIKSGNAIKTGDASPSCTAVALRPAVPGDEAFLYELYCSTRAGEIAAFGWDQAQQDAFLQLQFRGLQRHYQVQQLDVDSRIILQEGRPIGQLIVMRSATEIRLADIELLPQYRGAGIGTALIQSLLAESTESGRPVTLHVEKHSRAVPLYQRLGFLITSDIGFHYKMEWQPEGVER
jgi:ribosomal protein S18 acetylase RimI-like enzyme